MNNVISTYNVRIYAGQTFSLQMKARDQNGLAIDLTGAKVYAAVRADMKIAQASVQLTATNPNEAGWRTGIVIDPDQNANKGNFTVTFIPTDTKTLVAMGDDDPYFWDVWLVQQNGTDAPVIATSTFAIYPPATVHP